MPRTATATTYVRRYYVLHLIIPGGCEREGGVSFFSFLLFEQHLTVYIESYRYTDERKNKNKKRHWLDDMPRGYSNSWFPFPGYFTYAPPNQPPPSTPHLLQCSPTVKNVIRISEPTTHLTDPRGGEWKMAMSSGSYPRAPSGSKYRAALDVDEFFVLFFFLFCFLFFFFVCFLYSPIGAFSEGVISCIILIIPYLLLPSLSSSPLPLLLLLSEGSLIGRAPNHFQLPQTRQHMALLSSSSSSYPFASASSPAPFTSCFIFTDPALGAGTPLTASGTGGIAEQTATTQGRVWDGGTCHGKRRDAGSTGHFLLAEDPVHGFCGTPWDT